MNDIGWKQIRLFKKLNFGYTVFNMSKKAKGKNSGTETKDKPVSLENSVLIT